MNLVDQTDKNCIKITDTRTKETTIISPTSIENCMKPGTFIVTPIYKWEDKQTVEYRMKEIKVSIPKDALYRGDYQIEEIPFVPVADTVKPSCNPCRNCGRC